MREDKVGRVGRNRSEHSHTHEIDDTRPFAIVRDVMGSTSDDDDDERELIRSNG